MWRVVDCRACGHVANLGMISATDKISSVKFVLARPQNSMSVDPFFPYKWRIPPSLDTVQKNHGSVHYGCLGKPLDKSLRMDPGANSCWRILGFPRFSGGWSGNIARTISADICIDSNSNRSYNYSCRLSFLILEFTHVTATDLKKSGADREKDFFELSSQRNAKRQRFEYETETWFT